MKSRAICIVNRRLSQLTLVEIVWSIGMTDTGKRRTSNHWIVIVNGNRKLTIEVQDKERELHTTLECLQDVVEHGRNTERRNLLKMARREKRLKADWMNGWKSHRRKIDRARRRLYQVTLPSESISNDSLSATIIERHFDNLASRSNDSNFSFLWAFLISVIDSFI